MPRTFRGAAVTNVPEAPEGEKFRGQLKRWRRAKNKSLGPHPEARLALTWVLRPPLGLLLKGLVKIEATQPVLREKDRGPF